MESFDSRNTIRPLFLLQVTNAFLQMRPGEKLEVITNDRYITADLQRILCRCRHELKVVEQMDESGAGYRIWLIKRANA